MSQRIILTDRNVRIEDFDMPGVRRRTLRGGLSDGIDLIEVDNGVLQFSILPTRGMGLWRGGYRGMTLGWQAPTLGPVHPNFVNESDRGGLGWLTGFDEWLVRCGLNWNGPPGDDGGRPLTLHGRIANRPAHFVEVRHDGDGIEVAGEVEEAGLFCSRLRLRTSYSTRPGSNELTIRDEVTNLSGTPAEMQLLYHINFGPPLLGEGSRVRVPVRELWPMTAKALAAIDRYDTYAGPTPGFAEEVYCAFPSVGTDGRALAVLHDAPASKAVALRWCASELPCFTLWKNTAAIEDGYVTGLEPATNFPRFKAKERAAGRVVRLIPGETWSATMTMQFADAAVDVTAMIADVDAHQCVPIIHRTPLSELP